jgi:NADH:ubiquinone oxidoreductase subunit 6 (subunit J)
MNRIYDITFLISDVFEWLVIIIIGLAVIAFLYGVMKYGLSKSDSKREKARGIIVSGIIILFVMVSVWGLVGVISDTLDLPNNNPGTIRSFRPSNLIIR